MAFGISPKYVRKIQLDNLDVERFLAIAVEAASQLEWNIGYINQTGFRAYTQFSLSSWSEEVTVKISGKTVEIKSECTGAQILDWGKNKINVEDFLLTFEDVESAIAEEELSRKIIELQKSYAKDDDLLGKSPATTKGKVTGFFSIFKPTEGYFITPIIIDINILIFILMAISGINIMQPDSQSLLNWGANLKPVTLDGQWWRLLTACFLHIGIIHLALNMYALLYIGLLLEPYLGKVRFAAVYLLTGVASSLASLWWNDLVISAGASGAIFGMYGVFLAFLTTNLIDKSARKALMTSIVVFVGYNLLNGFKGSMESGHSVNVDNAAHIGGLLSGLIAGYAFVPSLKRPDSNKVQSATIGILTMIVLASTFFVCKSMPNDYAKYDEAMNQFVINETLALSVYKLPKDTPREKLLSEFKDKGIYWNENLKIVAEVEKLQLPEILKEKNLKLKEYCKLRIKSYEFAYKAIDENTKMYEKEINFYNQEIAQVVNEISGGQ